MELISNKTPTTIIRQIVIERAKLHIHDKFDTQLTVVIFVDDYDFTWEIRKVQNTYQINIIKGNDMYMTLCLKQDEDDLIYLRPFRVTSKIRKDIELDQCSSSEDETDETNEFSKSSRTHIFSPPHGRPMNNLDLSRV